MAKVLIGYSACPLSRAAFEKHGHDVWTCDLLPARDNSPKHLQGDVWDFLCRDWDFAVPHPMCTYLTTSAAWAYMDPDFEKHPEKGGYHQKPAPSTLTGADRRAARTAAIANFKRLLDLPYPVAIENPAVSYVNKALRRPSQVVNPFQFGDDASKATGLWLSEGVPLLAIDPAQYVEPRLVCENKHTFQYGQHKCPECSSNQYLPRWANQTDSGQNRLSPGAGRWLERSETYPGIAAAMGQWAEWLSQMDASNEA